MSPVHLNIKEIIGTPNAIIQSFGLKIFDEASILLSKNIPVVLDFSGIDNITSGFCNASIGKLYSTYSTNIDILLKIENINSLGMEKINDAIDLVSNSQKAQLIDKAVSALFE